MTGDKKWFSSLTPLSHKEYVTFGDDKKGKVLGISVIKVNNHFTLKDIALVEKSRYNLLSVSHLVDTNLDILFRKSGSMFLILMVMLFVVFLILESIFKVIFFAQPSLKCLISQSSSELWKWHRRLGHLSFDLLC
jgi:hypothetical protein